MTSTQSNAHTGNTNSSSPKLGAVVAKEILADITAKRLPVGELIGSEAALLERYGVSRAVFREAVRLLEHLNVARTRRGPGGGLLVDEPSTAAVVQAVVVFLTQTDMSLDDLIEARISIESSVARRAAEHARDEDVARLRERVVADTDRDQLNTRAHHVLHTLVAGASKNVAAELFVDVLGRLTARWSYPQIAKGRRRATLQESAQAHSAIVDAITAGDAGLAAHRMTNHLRALGAFLGRRAPAEPASLAWVLDENTNGKLGTQVALSLIVEIVDRGWPIGEVIGSEASLTERFGVSRSALREAVRLLEYHHIAAMRRGPGGGLVVTSPSVEPIIESATVYLSFRGVTAADLIDLRIGLESDAIALAVEHSAADELADLELTMSRELEQHFEGALEDELHVRIADLSRNPAIALFIRVLVQLTRLNAVLPYRRSPRRALIDQETTHAHHAIVEAMKNRDVPLAQRRMNKHLSAMQSHLR